MMIKYILNQIKKIYSIGREALGSKVVPGVFEEEELIRRARYVNATRTTMVSGISQVLTVIIGIISVTLTVRYLGNERYGLWLIISSILTWLNLTDFGVGNALTNKLSEASGRNQSEKSQNFVASAFWLLSLVGILIIITGIILGKLLPWASLLNVKSIEASLELPLAITLSLIIFGLGLPLSITKNVYRGYQEGYYAYIWDIAANIFSLLTLVIVSRLDGGLPLLVSAVYGTRQIVLAGSAFFLFQFHRPLLKPNPHNVRKANFRPLLNLGFMFIFLQLSGLLISQSDNFVIIRLLDPAHVAIFATTFKLFNYATMFKSWILTPLWPAYGEAYARLDLQWIRRTLKYSLLLSILLTIAVSGFLVIFARAIIQVWVGIDLVPSFELVIGIALMQILWAWTEPFVVFLNGISKLRRLTIYSLGTAISKLVFTIIFVSLWGIEGAIIGTLVGYLLFAAWLLPLDVKGALNEIKITLDKQNHFSL